MQNIIIASVLIILVLADIIVSTKDYFLHHENLKLMRWTFITSFLLMIFWIFFAVAVKIGPLPIILIFSYTFVTAVRIASYQDEKSKKKEMVVGLIIVTKVEDDEKNDLFLE